MPKTSWKVLPPYPETDDLTISIVQTYETFLGSSKYQRGDKFFIRVNARDTRMIKRVVNKNMRKEMKRLGIPKRQWPTMIKMVRVAEWLFF